jgi:hypothetical protein
MAAVNTFTASLAPQLPDGSRFRFVYLSGMLSVLRVGRVSVSIRRLVQVQLGRPQLNEAASGSKAGPAESYRIGKAFLLIVSLMSISSCSFPR